MIHLDEQGRPPYGVAVILRPKPGLFWNCSRTAMFGGCCAHPMPAWKDDEQQLIASSDVRDAALHLARHREATIASAQKRIRRRVTPRKSK